jgi:hypothetical protein
MTVLTRRKITLRAPYVGRPFVYVTRCTVDDYLNGDLGKVQLVYASNDFTLCYGSFEYTHEARNGHDADTPVWP